MCTGPGDLGIANHVAIVRSRGIVTASHSEMKKDIVLLVDEIVSEDDGDVGVRDEVAVGTAAPPKTGLVSDFPATSRRAPSPPLLHPNIRASSFLKTPPSKEA